MAGTPAAIVDACHWSSAGCLQCLGKFGNIKSHPLASASSHQSLSIWKLDDVRRTMLDVLKIFEARRPDYIDIIDCRWSPMEPTDPMGVFSHVFSQVTAQPSAVATGAAHWPCWRTCNLQRCWDEGTEWGKLRRRTDKGEGDASQRYRKHQKSSETIRNHTKPAYFLTHVVCYELCVAGSSECLQLPWRSWRFAGSRAVQPCSTFVCQCCCGGGRQMFFHFSLLDGCHFQIETLARQAELAALPRKNSQLQTVRDVGMYQWM